MMESMLKHWMNKCVEFSVFYFDHLLLFIGHERLKKSQFVPVTIALAVGVFTLLALLIYILVRSLCRRQKRNSVLLVGLSGSGKTSIFTRMMKPETKGNAQTFTSITTNTANYSVGRDSKRKVRLIDIPGHDRLRNKLFDRHKYDAKAVAFVVDASVLKSKIRDIANGLYTILEDEAVNSKRQRFQLLVACHKSDDPLSKAVSVVKSELEKEIQILREIRNSTSVSGNPSSIVDDTVKPSSNFQLVGKADQDFKFSHLPFQVSFCESTIKEADGMDSFKSWLDSTV